MIDRGEIRKRKKTPSRKFRHEFGHTLLSIGDLLAAKFEIGMLKRRLAEQSRETSSPEGVTLA